MAVYTTQLRSVIESGVEIFNQYPIFDETYRAVLNQKIIDRYYFHEIGLETVGQFKHFLKSRMNEIMPYYNQLYESEAIEFDPMITMRIVETFTRTNDGTSDTIDNTITDGLIVNDGSVIGESATVAGETSTGKVTHSDNPQVVASATNYATTADDTTGDTDSTINSDSTDTTHNENKIDTTTNGTSTNTVSAQENYEKETIGNAGVTSDARLIMDLRDSFLNIDKLIIDELADLFMNIY